MSAVNKRDLKEWSVMDSDAKDSIVDALIPGGFGCNHVLLNCRRVPDAQEGAAGHGA